MDKSKIDPHLQIEMESEPDGRRTIFVRVGRQLTEAEQNDLRLLGASGMIPGRTVFSAHVTTGEMEVLSNLDYVSFLESSHKLAMKSFSA